MKKEDIFQLSIVVIGIISLIMNFVLFKDWRGIFYYTILSNMYVVFFYLSVLLLKKKNKLVKNEKYHLMKGLMLVSVLCTMFIYFGVMNNNESIYVGHRLECDMVHIVMPLLALSECILFEKRGVLKYKYVPIWGITSIIYLGILGLYRIVFDGTFLRGNKYPYSIINYERYGIIKCFINCTLIFVVFILLGIIIVFIDRKLNGKVNGDCNE